MPKVEPAPFEVTKTLQVLGERIRVARLRRQMSQDELAEACQLNRRTVYRIEQGAAGIAIGNICTVLWVLGLLSTVDAVADPDTDDHGKILENANRAKRARKSAIHLDENDF